MKLKYYLRGLGIGIIVTTLILTSAHNFREKSQKNNESETTEHTTEEDTLFPETTPVTETTSSLTEPETTEPETTEPETTEPETTEPETTEPEITEPETTKTDYVTATITISSGMYSESVSRILADAGVIKDANDFNAYLIRTRYSEKIQTGTFSVSSQMSYEEIAKIITKIQ